MKPETTTTPAWASDQAGSLRTRPKQMPPTTNDRRKSAQKIQGLGVNKSRTICRASDREKEAAVVSALDGGVRSVARDAITVDFSQRLGDSFQTPACATD